ncbi:Multidrug resistance-associated protein 1 [Aphelenchoides besseyi]|nr:Multidrug resistance-associated protein 1 [Aphelenchoides besseyi]
MKMIVVIECSNSSTLSSTDYYCQLDPWGGGTGSNRFDVIQLGNLNLSAGAFCMLDSTTYEEHHDFYDGILGLGFKDGEEDYLIMPEILALFNKSVFVIWLADVQIGKYSTDGVREARVFSGDSYLTAAASDFHTIIASIGAQFDYRVDEYVVECDQKATLPDLIITIAEREFHISAYEYLFESTAGDGLCNLGVYASGELEDPDVWELSEPFLRAHCVAFDYDKKQIGRSTTYQPDGRGFAAEFANGTYAKDNFGIASLSIDGQIFGAASFIYEVLTIPLDGYLGLSWSVDDSIPDVLKGLTKHLESPMFTIFLKPLSIGKYSDQRSYSALTYTAEDFLIVPTSFLDQVIRQTGAVFDDYYGLYYVECESISSLPNMTISTKSSNFPLSANQYISTGITVISFVFSFFWLLPDFLLLDEHHYRQEHLIHLFGDLTFHFCAFVSYILCLRFGYISSGLLHLTWLLRVFSLLPIILSTSYALIEHTDNIPKINAPAFSFCLSLAQFVASCALTVSFWLPDVAHTNYQALDQMLRLSPAVQTTVPTGVIINYLTVDIMRIRVFWSYMRDLVICPIFLSMFLLAQIVGYFPASMGMIVLFVFMAFNVLTSKFAMRFYRAQMNYKDARLKLINDILNGIRVLKLYGWETSMEKLTEKARARELNEIKKTIPFNSCLDASFDLGPIVKMVLTPSIAFMTLFLYGTVRVSINFLPQLFTCIVTAFVSLKRLVEFFNMEERPPTSSILSPVLEDNEIVHMENANFSWTDKEEDFSLRDITFNVKRGELVAIWGKVGSGKSTLLNALCHEIHNNSGLCAIRPMRTAYVSQQAWIQNLTLRDNILFDSEFQPSFYDHTLEACALKYDLNTLPSGDLTEIGEKGINLSGGQKARVSLARAVYHQADFYLLDDVLSAVDSHVGEHIFNQAIGPFGCLNKTTRIVALNSTHFLNQFDKIICLSEGRITHFGSYQSLIDDPNSPISKHSVAADKATEFEHMKTDNQNSQSSSDVEEKPREKDELVEKENMSYGRVGYYVYWDYIKGFGVWTFASFLFLLMGVSCSMTALANVYLAHWSSSVNETSTTSLQNLEIYAGLGVGASVVFFIAYIIQGLGGYYASKVFHNDLTKTILRAPMSDIDFIDANATPMISGFFMSLEEICYSMLSVFIVIPYLIVVLLPYSIAFVILVRFFNASFSQFRRMSTSALSKICTTASEVYTGLASVRVYGATGRFRSLLNNRIDQLTEANFVEQSTTAWMRIVLCMITNVLVFIFLIVGVWLSHRGMISAGLLAMIVNSSFSMSRMFANLALVFRSLETEIVSVERVKEYIAIEREPIWKPTKMAPLKKVANSRIEFQNVWLRYREQDQPVLRDVNFVIQPGEKIAVVGRTGAGKTSLTSLLFRLIEPFEGEVRIGDVNISDYGTNLRRLLTIIPQDPVLFCGNLRSNLDPFEEHNDTELWSALRKAHLSDYVENLNGKLNAEIAEGGSNLSVGQRQLVCLARALLRTTSILVLDEATAAVDLQTDALIQETIRKNFADATIMTIAHRLHTIMDYQKVLVMESGEVREFDTIKKLINDNTSAFYKFAEKAGVLKH